MEFIFDNNKPIYKQLVDQLTVAIVTNVYKPGEKIPSVREYALMMNVNPNTINRALLELEDKKLIITKRTSGKFVTEDTNILNEARNNLAKETVNEFKNSMNKLNISIDEIIRMIKGE